MPWVNEDMCVGCGICVDDCPVGAITLKDNRKATINDDGCIRCGRCHDVCPRQAVRHDSERIPQEIEANIKKTKSLLKHFKNPEQKQAFLERMVRYFKKQQKVASLTVDRIISMKADPVSH